MNSVGTITRSRAPGLAVEAGEEHLAGGAAERDGVLGHDRDARLHGVGHRHVVDPHQRDLVVAPERLERVHRADRDEVLAREQGGGGVRPVEQLERARRC